MSQFRFGSEPLWAWVCSVLDPQDAIKELFNCVLCIWVPSRYEKRRPDVPVENVLVCSEAIPRLTLDPMSE